MMISRIKVHNWRNFRDGETPLRNVAYVLGPNASGKSNFLDIFRFLRDICKPVGGGLQTSVSTRGGLSKIRCLHARQKPEVEIEIDLSETVDSPQPAWRYHLSFTAESSGKRRVVVKRETVEELRADGKLHLVLNRPDTSDLKDHDRLTETALEQMQSNAKFRELREQLAKTTYLHLVPQLIKFADELGGRKLEDDPFGQGFLERIAKCPNKVRKGRLSRIEKALRNVVPKFKNLEFVQDKVTGRPHLEIRFEHHRPTGAIQREDQFSDGTLRLISLFWLLLDGESRLLLEEPELSLNLEIVSQIPRLIDVVQRSTKKRRQVIITTHSEALLSNPGIDGRSIVILEPSDEGTAIKAPNAAELTAMKAGLPPGEVVLPRARRLSSSQLELQL